MRGERVRYVTEIFPPDRRAGDGALRERASGSVGEYQQSRCGSHNQNSEHSSRIGS